MQQPHLEAVFFLIICHLFTDTCCKLSDNMMLNWEDLFSFSRSVYIKGNSLSVNMELMNGVDYYLENLLGLM